MATTTVSGDAPVIVDPSGDVILVVGAETLNIQVSSHVLGLASTVFKAMFKPHFQEGFSLIVTKESPVTILLPEDDPAAVSLTCKILHHQIDHTTENPSLALLSKLATFCDKYDCIRSIRPSAHQWIQRHLVKTPLEKFEAPLVLSYIFDDPELFSTVTAELVLKCNGSFGEYISKDGCDTLPASLYCEFVSTITNSARSKKQI